LKKEKKKLEKQSHWLGLSLGGKDFPFFFSSSKIYFLSRCNWGFCCDALLYPSLSPLGRIALSSVAKLD